MSKKGATFDLSAEIALSALGPAEREEVMVALRRVEADPSVVRASAMIRKVKGTPGLYVLRVGERLRVLFSVEPDESIVVRDILNQGMVEEFRRQAAG